MKCGRKRHFVLILQVFTGTSSTKHKIEHECLKGQE